MDDSKPLVSLTKALSVIPSPDSIPPLGLPFSADEFISQSLWRPRGARGVFGGQVIAQALLSASHTVPKPVGLHSQHSYFLLPADAGIPILYTVERLRDGKSYATRLVRASQKRKVVFVLLASFALPPISLPPLKEGPSPPFGFIPTFSNPSPIVTQKQTNQEVLGLSHSLRFAVEPNPSTRPLLESRVVEPVFQKPHLSISVVPGYAERWQVPMPEGVMMWDECELEEKRWQRYLDDQGDELKDRGRAAVEEYIQVGSSSNFLQ